MSEEKSLLSKIANAALNAGAAITGAVGTVREIQSMQIEYAVKEKTYELMEKLMSIQQKQMELQELLMESKNKIIDLEQEKNNLIQWEDDKLNYELFTPGSPATVTYRFKFPDDPEQPMHYLCVNCYNKNKKSILQLKSSKIGSNVAYMVCHHCLSEYLFNVSVFKKK